MKIIIYIFYIRDQVIIAVRKERGEMRLDNQKDGDRTIVLVSFRGK